MLTKTNNGNWAKEVTIANGVKWRFCGNFSTLEQAESAAQLHADKGRVVRVVEMETSKSGSKKCHERAVAKAIEEAAARGLRGEELKAVAAAVAPLPVGNVYFRVEAYISQTKQVMQHASREECLAVGKTPGHCND
jgi:hypothetical protein